MGFINNILNKFKNLLGREQACEKQLQNIRSLNIGDIIKYNDVFCVLCNAIEEENVILLVPIDVADIKDASLVKLSEINFNKMFWTSKFNICEFIDTFDETKKLAMLKRYKCFVDNLINKYNKQRGSVVSKNDDYFYIYGEESNKWLLFKLDKIMGDNCQKIQISNIDFFTTFDEKKEIDKNDNSYKVEMLADTLEIEKIKLLKKSFKKRNESQIKSVNKEFDFSTIVYLKKNPSKRYFVLKNYSLRILVVPYESIFNGMFIPEVLNIEEIMYANEELKLDELSIKILKEMANKKIYSKPSTVATKKHR